MRIFGLVLVLIAHSLSAEVIVLRDGSVLRGRVSMQSSSHLVLETADGKKELEKNSIFRVFYNENQFKAFEARDGGRLAEMRAQASEWQRQLDKVESDWKEKFEQQEKQHEEELNEEKTRYTRDMSAARLEAFHEMRGALWRSALLPGWPQWRRGQKVPSVLLMGGTALALLNLQQSYNKLYAARREFAGVLEPAVYSQMGTAGLALNYQFFENKSAQVRGAQNRLNLAWLILAAVWTTGMVHTLSPPPPPAAPVQPAQGATRPLDLSFTFRF